MSLNLTSGQQEALDSICDLQKKYSNGGGIGIVSGLAGTGKSTLLGILAEEHGAGMLVVAPTGKAALRVREVGARASTIHQWLYKVDQNEKTGQLEVQVKPLDSIEVPDCGFLVVDEASMVGFDVFRDLYRTCRDLELNLILVGDGFQLPPVESNSSKKAFSVFLDEFPSHFKVNMTEILRQALDSPIIRASMAVRTGRWVEDALADLPSVPARRLNELALQTWEDGGATICHRNATRHKINRAIREARELPDGLLMANEPLLVSKNNYQVFLFNGEIATVRKQPVPINTSPVPVRDRHHNSSCYVNFLSVELDVEDFKQVVVADREVFGTLGEVGDWVVKRTWRDSDLEGSEILPYLHANLGYALTVHRSQGSAWPIVLFVVEPSIRLNSTEGRRFVYTALTRAERQVKVCWLNT